MRIQQGISAKALGKFIGRDLKVLIEEKDNEKDDVYLGRTQYDAPDVDGLIYVHSKKDLPVGDFVKVLVTGSLEYDLIGEVS
jgi:ribosomal protein S12 methylthiotransferase